MLFLPKHFAAKLAAFFSALLVPVAVWAGAYEAHLPDNLATAKDMCALLPCKDVFPGALSFSERMGSPPYVQAFGAMTVPFKARSGWVDLSADQIRAIALAVGAHVQAAFAVERDVDAAIAAGSVTTIEQIDDLFRAAATISA